MDKKIKPIIWGQFWKTKYYLKKLLLIEGICEGCCWNMFDGVGAVCAT